MASPIDGVARARLLASTLSALLGAAGCQAEEDERTVQEMSALRVALSDMRAQLKQGQADLLNERRTSEGLTKELAGLQAKFERESPNAFFATIAEMRVRDEAWASAARTFVLTYPSDARAKSLGKALASWEAERLAAETIASLGTVKMSEVYADMTAFQGKLFDRQFSCRSPTVDDAMDHELGLIAYQLKVDGADYRFKSDCHVIGEDSPGVDIFWSEAQLKELVHSGAKVFPVSARVRVLSRYNSDITSAAERIF